VSTSQRGRAQVTRVGCIKIPNQMRPDADRILHALLSNPPDFPPSSRKDSNSRPIRAHAHGRSCAAPCLDELPKFLPNVPQGQMSVVGPRPIVKPSSNARRPMITCWRSGWLSAASASVSVANNLSLPEPVRLDVTTPRTQTFWLESHDQSSAPSEDPVAHGQGAYDRTLVSDERQGRAINNQATSSRCSTTGSSQPRLDSNRRDPTQSSGLMRRSPRRIVPLRAAPGPPGP